MAWDPDYIDFIYNYCDRWCERCPLTHRCVVFTRENDPEQIEECSDAVEKAMEELRVELAMPEPPARPWLEAILNAPPPAPAERREIDREFDERRRRLESNPMRNVAMDYAVDSRAWLGLYEAATQARVEAAAPVPDGSEEAAAVVRMEIVAVLDALRVVRWDGSLIAAKLGRALSGKEYGPESVEDDPIQTDFNGSAKLTLLLLERSEAAWHLIARWAPEREVASQFANTLMALRAEVERAFPNARRFVRPGFDEMPT